MSCTSCLAGYTFAQATSSCSPVTVCTGGCSVCPLNYILSSTNECLQCGSTSCARCSPTALSTCTTCYDGNYLNQGVCSACPTGCSTCSSPQNCLTCSSGYTAQVQSIATQTSCVKCQAPCALCIGNAQTCTKCLSGYTLSGWNCMSNFNYGFNVVLGTNLTTFYANYAGFLNALTGAVQSNNYNSLTISTIQSGSVIVNGNANTGAQSDSNEATQQFNNLNSVLSTGGSIAGMPVQSSTVSVNGGSIVQPTSGPNLALILGICIPVGVILLVLIGICIYKNTRKGPQVDYPTTSTVREQFELQDVGTPK